jgi:hypothetical protein
MLEHLATNKLMGEFSTKIVKGPPLKVGKLV